MSNEPTHLDGSEWDVGVIGAGPAGSAVATQLAAAGHRVLLTDKQRMPRAKVCGGCLGAVGHEALGRIEGVSELRFRRAALETVQIRSGDRGVRLSIGERAAIDRAEFDAALTDHAARHGAQTAFAWRSSIGPATDAFRLLTLSHADGRAARVRCRAIVIAAGLGSAALLPAAERPATITRRASRVGVGVTIEDRSSAYPAGEIVMATSRSGDGYVGIVRLPDGRLDLAAALAPRSVSLASISAVVRRVLSEACSPVPSGLDDAQWQATPRLTQRPRRLGAARVLLVGDAAGYVEPFTGEGIGWALRSAVAAAPLVAEAVNAWRPRLVDEWEKTHRAAVGGQHSRCRLVCGAVGGRLVTPWVVRALAAAPWLAGPIVRSIDPRPGATVLASS
ncbi:MAG: FAD-dependent monooxygenase [Planctomycetota bacterium]